MFSELSKKTLIKAALFQNAPVYVQFYVTARCNLTCEQCNIIYANSDVEECSLEKIERIADNFSEMGVAIVLLTGGEPFARKDIAKIIYAFESRGIHVRMQTNGFATEDQICEAIEAGGKDISISLDSLRPSLQDKINGSFENSWHQALKAMSLFMKHLPKEGSFASLGCVLQPSNMRDIENVIKFGTEISWFTSLVPAHVADQSAPLGFRTFDRNLIFQNPHFDEVETLIEKVRSMRRDGYLLYDSDQYLDDIKKFIKNEPVEWREKNGGVCDSPNLYFAVLPNGEFAPCCDHRTLNSDFTYDKNFPSLYKAKAWRKSVIEITQNGSGCMYGSYPEMTISMRYLKAKIERIKLFLAKPPEKKWPFSYEELLETAHLIQMANNTEPPILSKKIMIKNG